MNELLIYLLKSAGLLSIFYVFYQLLLKADTSFRRNRKFLLGGIVAAALLPAFYFTRTVIIQSPVVFEQFQSAIAGQNAISPQAEIDWWLLGGIIYLSVFAILFSRFLFQVSAILKLISESAKKKSIDFKYIETRLKTCPFSFFHFIVFNPNLHSREELKLILEHEKVHAQQKHSIDILLANLMVALLWFNPLSWWYKKCIEQNLEFIADSEAAKNSLSKIVYQKTLVKVSMGVLAPALSTNFYQSSIKKRIIMLNKNHNPKNNSWKIALILPALFAFVFLFSCSNTTEIEQTRTSTEKKSTTPLIVVDDKIKDRDFDVNSISPERIDKVHVLKGIAATKKYGDKGKNGVMEITLKSGTETIAQAENPESFHFSTIEPLIIIDGKVMKSDFNLDSVDKNKIEKLNVQKGDAAIQKYGKKATGGVIEITMKK